MNAKNIRCIVGTAWVLCGVLCIGFGDIADTLAHTGNRLYLPGGDRATLLGIIFLILGGILSVPAVLTTTEKQPRAPQTGPARESDPESCSPS